MGSVRRQLTAMGSPATPVSLAIIDTDSSIVFADLGSL